MVLIAKRIILPIMLLILILSAVISVNVLKEYTGQLPSTKALEEIKPSLETKIYDINNNLIGQLFTERRTVVPLSKIPVDLQNAVIAIEDHQFFKHWGISLRGTGRAFIENVIHMRFVQGGSTITQQLSRSLFLNQKKTLRRKIKEALVSLQIEAKYSKEEILGMYLNQIYFGHGAYGIESAAYTFFGKPPGNLNLAECAMLAGLIRTPAKYSPISHPEAARERFKIVLKRMRKLGLITPQEERISLLQGFVARGFKPIEGKAPYFIDSVRQYLETKYGYNATYKGGLRVFTTLDLTMNEYAEKALEENLSKFEEIKGATTVQGAIIAMDITTGEIRTLVGGRNFKASQFNRATQALRQPGSCFKLFVYTAAMDKGFTAATIIDDSPVVFYKDGNEWKLLKPTSDLINFVTSGLDIDTKRLWAPRNYSNKFNGPTPLRIALQDSLNVCAVKVTQKIGPGTVISYARKLGINSPLGDNLSLALGSSEVSLIEMTRSFATIANRGIQTTPYYVRRVEDVHGVILENNSPREKVQISAQTAFLITNLLKGVVQNGTGWRAKMIGCPVAGKTGTTNEFSDAWFIGYTPSLVCGVWVGYDDTSTLGKDKTGGAVATPIWTQFMQQAVEGTPVMDFTVPKGIVFVNIDPETGLLAPDDFPKPFREAFLEGTEPTEFVPSTTTDKE